MVKSIFNECVTLVTEGRLNEAIELLLDHTLKMREYDRKYNKWKEFLREIADAGGTFYDAERQFTKNKISYSDRSMQLSNVRERILIVNEEIESARLKGISWKYPLMTWSKTFSQMEKLPLK